MIQKKAVKSTLFSKFQKGLKVVIAAEIAAFLGSYCVWLRMNRDQEFRGYINDKFPYLLEGFYKIGEIFDKDSLARLRQIDSAAFEVKKSK